MWEVLVKRPRGRLSSRNFLSIATALLVALLTNLTFLTQPTYADTDAKWSSQGQIEYAGDTYAGPAPTQSLQPAAPADAEAVYMISVNPSLTKIIFFPKGSDPAKATSAQFVEATPNGPTGGTYTANAPPKTISLTAKGTSGDVVATGQDTASSCAISGIGWIVCPVSEKLASAMDYLFKLLSEFLIVQPLLSDKTNVIYTGWTYMRNFANIAFVIAFLIIIYSQVTNFGISSYGMKKLLPRLVLSAVLVNISYWICAAAIDLSNIFGSNLNEMFISLRSGLMKGSETVSLPTWSSVTAAALGGTGLAIGTGALIVTSGGVLAFIVPMLVIVAVSALTAIVVLAARQAILIILVIIAPIAFVAFLLPNTDKYFDRWRSLFVTLLMIFPIFSFLFGGAQLAGIAIILASAGNIVTIIFGMAVQVIPVAITPLLFKFGGSVLARIGGIVNNPQKGVVDRSKNWAKGVSGRQTVRGAEAGNKFGAMYAGRQLKNEARDEQFKKRRANIYGRSSAGMRNAERMHTIQREADRIQAEHDVHINAKIKIDKKHFEREMRVLNAQDNAAHAKEVVNAMRSEYKTGYRDPAIFAYGPQDERSTRLQDEAVHTAQNIALTGIRKSQADNVISSDINSNLLSSQALQKYATGVGDHELMLAGVVAKDRKEYGEHVAAQEQLMKHFKLESDDYQKLAMSRAEVTKRDASGNEHTFRFTNEYSKEAAIENQFKAGSYNQKMEIIEETGQNVTLPNGATRVGVNYDHRATIQSAAIASGVSGAAPFINDKTYDAILKGEYNGVESTAHHAIRQVFEGRLKAENLSKANAKALRIIYSINDPGAEFKAPEEAAIRDAIIKARDEFMRTHTPEEIATFEGYYEGLGKQANTILSTPTIAQNTNEESQKVFERYRSID